MDHIINKKTSKITTPKIKDKVNYSQTLRSGSCTIVRRMLRRSLFEQL